MQYIEMTIEEANKLCKKNATVLVAITDFREESLDTTFVKRKGCECDELFVDAKTVFKSCDDFMKQLSIFTEKQDMENITTRGIMKTVLLKE